MTFLNTHVIYNNKILCTNGHTPLYRFSTHFIMMDPQQRRCQQEKLGEKIDPTAYVKGTNYLADAAT